MNACPIGNFYVPSPPRTRGITTKISGDKPYQTKQETDIRRSIDLLAGFLRHRSSFSSARIPEQGLRYADTVGY